MSAQQPKYDSQDRVKANLARVGELVDAQMRFWNDFFATILDVVPLGAFGKKETCLRMMVVYDSREKMIRFN